MTFRVGSENKRWLSGARLNLCHTLAYSRILLLSVGRIELQDAKAIEEDEGDDASGGEENILERPLAI